MISQKRMDENELAIFNSLNNIKHMGIIVAPLLYQHMVFVYHSDYDRHTYQEASSTS